MKHLCEDVIHVILGFSYIEDIENISKLGSIYYEIVKNYFDTLPRDNIKKYIDNAYIYSCPIIMKLLLYHVGLYPNDLCCKQVFHTNEDDRLEVLKLLYNWTPIDIDEETWHLSLYIKEEFAYAVTLGHYKLIKFMVNYLGLNPNIYTLISAVIFGNLKIVEFLLDWDSVCGGIDPWTHDAKALRWAMKLGFKDIEKLLLSQYNNVDESLQGPTKMILKRL